MATQEKVGRNSPCPCGSSEKYKHCCLGKQAEIENKSRLNVSLIFFIVGLLASIGLGFSKGISFGLSGAAAALIVAGAIYVFRDPNPPRGSSENASAINFGK